MPPLRLQMRLINVNKMANVFVVLLAWIWYHFTSIFIFVSLTHAQNSIGKKLLIYK